MPLIEAHSLLANGFATALVTPDARLTWLCVPRPDSGALFAELLDGPDAGHLSVAPVTPAGPPRQSYRPGTLIMETRWPGLTVTDSLADRPAGPDRGCLVRHLTGDARVRVTFAPRPDFGLAPARLVPIRDGVSVRGAGLPVSLRCADGPQWIIEPGPVAGTELDLPAMGGSAVIELCWGRSRASARRETAGRAWTAWTSTLRPPGVDRAAELRSALTLRALCYRPTGAILAAATTSLPEAIGGMRNWDYRYCWLRDSAMTARALVDMGSTAEAEALLGFLAGCVERTGGHPERLAPMYAIDGLPLGAERELAHLAGYEGSRPVRVGNGAATQVQLDVFGPVVDLVDAVTADREEITDGEWSTVEAMVAAVARRWRDPDHGLWEARMDARHHVYTKVMCWLTVDRAMAIATRFSLPVPAAWPRLRRTIARQVLERGWHPGTGAYTVAYGSPDLDAASLWIGLSGLLPGDHPRFVATVDATSAGLREGPTVYRYRWDDGMPGREGGFHICATWLVEALALAGRHDEAHDLFASVLACAGPTGLLPEQYDPVAGRGLGNHPQAYSHLGVIRAAVALAAAGPTGRP